MMQESTRHAVTKTAGRGIKLWLICLAVAALWVAIDTRGFTRQPHRWWDIGTIPSSSEPQPPAQGN